MLETEVGVGGSCCSVRCPTTHKKCRSKSTAVCAGQGQPEHPELLGDVGTSRLSTCHLLFPARRLLSPQEISHCTSQKAFNASQGLDSSAGHGVECPFGWLQVGSVLGGLSQECSTLTPIDLWLLKDKEDTHGSHWVLPLPTPTQETGL